MGFFAIFQILLAGILGAFIGWERKVFAGKDAGTKTYALVCIGSTMYTLISRFGFTGGINGDPARVAANIVVGIGFIGAGMVMIEGNQTKGLTTAACLWVTAAIGMGIGVEWYSLSILTAIIVFAFLYIPNKFIYPRQKERLQSKEK